MNTFDTDQKETIQVIVKLCLYTNLPDNISKKLEYLLSFFKNKKLSAIKERDLFKDSHYCLLNKMKNSEIKANKLYSDMNLAKNLLDKNSEIDGEDNIDLHISYLEEVISYGFITSIYSKVLEDVLPLTSLSNKNRQLRIDKAINIAKIEVNSVGIVTKDLLINAGITL